jgi:hypothetical protein
MCQLLLLKDKYSTWNVNTTACFLTAVSEKSPQLESGFMGSLVSFFFLVSCGELRLSPFGTSATNWPIVPAPDDR